MKKTYKGIIKQIVGPVIDVKFEAGFIPALKSAIYFEINGNPEVAEVALHQGNGMVKCIAMGATEGLQRGIEVTTYNEAIQAPVGDAVLQFISYHHHLWI